MKTRKKVLLALLSATCITAGAFGLAACSGGGGDNRDANIVNVYNQYVAYAESNGETPMSYETWLNTIKGQPGAPGAAGKSAYDIYRENFLKNNPGGMPLPEDVWLASLAGKDGNGIEKVELNADETKLIITYTNGDTEEVDLPEALTHVHDYGNDYTVLIEPTAELDGFGYKICKDCGHVEAIAVKPYYKVKVYLPDGKTPAAGVKVTLNGVDVNTDSEGMAVFESVSMGEYDITATKSGYAQVEVPKTNENENSYSVVLAQELQGDFIDINPGNEVGDKKSFHVTSVYTSSFYNDGWTEYDVYLEGGESSYAKYQITFNGEYGDLVYWEGFAQRNRSDIEDDGVITFVAGPGESVQFRMTVSNMCMDDDYDYSFTVERLTPPELGEKDAPIAAETDETITLNAAANEEVYYKISTLDGKTYVFEYDNGVTVTALGENKNSNGTLITSNELTVNGVSGNYFVKVSSASGNGSFKMKRVYAAGEQGNPNVMTLGTTYAAVVDFNQGIYDVWYSFTVTTPGKYTLSTSDGYASYSIYSGDNPFEATPVAEYLSSPKYIMDLTAGTYYFVMQASCNVDLHVYNSATDDGYSSTCPKEVNDLTTLTLTSTDDMYFKYTVTQDGTFVLTALLNADGDATSYFSVYSDDSFDYSAIIHNSQYGVSNYEVAAHIGDVIYFTAHKGYSDDTHIVNFGVYDVTQAVANTLVVKGDDGTLFENVSVTVNGETKTTNANGEVVFDLVPGDNYTVALVLGDYAENYVYTTVTLNKAYAPCTVDVTAKKIRDFTFTVKIGDEAAGAGITVSYGSYSAQTDANGVAVIKMTNPDVYQGGDIVNVTDIPSGYEFASTGMFLDEGEYNYELVLTVVPITITGDTFEVEAGQAYRLSVGYGVVTLSVSAGHIATFNGTSFISVNGLEVNNGELEPGCVDDGVGYTTLIYFSFGETLTIVFSENATLTIS